MRRLAFLLPLVILLAAGGLFAVMLLRDRNPSEVPSALIGSQAPQFALPRVEGLVDTPGFATADLSGDLTIVNIFASWCVPCRVEHPLLTRLSEEGYRVYGINYRDEDAKAVAFLTRLGNPYARVGADRDARVSLDWGVTGVPETFVIDSGGIVRYKFTGPLTPRNFERTFLPRLRDIAR